MEYEKSFFSPKSFSVLYSWQHTATSCNLLRLLRNSFSISSLECNYRKLLAHLLQLDGESFITMAIQFVLVEVKLKEITSFVWIPFCEVRETDLIDIPSNNFLCKPQNMAVLGSLTWYVSAIFNFSWSAAQAISFCITVTVNSLYLHTN
jgi:hypothetical protein